MRKIALDTETTGLDPSKGDRVVEIGAVEIANLIPTGRVFHVYINPERDMPEEAFRVHGLSAEFLSGHKKFAEIAADFNEFILGAELIIHNAEFDVRFLNAELSRLSLPGIDLSSVTDTLALARRRHPGASNSLDALCQRYGVDASRREKHGALLDAQLLAEVYAELMGGRQAALSLSVESRVVAKTQQGLLKSRPQPLPPRLTAEEAEAHRAFARTIGKTPLWGRYLALEEG
ncbi:DNA polymerase III subunit epsilon [Methylocystis heyeri]|uniref:DNA polymerase III subunit epsilon n=1 Tax=Methylocystis heyeri TaxID=391905 RepID=A0A6B8KF38_9HYPH|nr:DNA polymerase III subunit epsilon [Methylocystis heyeri]QGM47084.1 DNA polymerase III subunit epsilon [Methylocystis heyeri]